jgi:hypothetical protein
MYVRAARREGGSQPPADIPNQFVIRYPNGDGWATGGDNVRHQKPRATQHQRECPWPEPGCQSPGLVGNLSADLLYPSRITQQERNRQVGRPLLGYIDPPHSVRLEGVCADAVDSVSRKGNQVSLLQGGNCLGQCALRSGGEWCVLGVHSGPIVLPNRCAVNWRSPTQGCIPDLWTT